MLQKPPQQKRRKITEYGYQLQEKQKAKQAYGLREKQFRSYFISAAKNRAETSKTFLQTLESRLDNVIFRAGLAISRSQARQLVSHRHFALNGKRVNIPSILVKPGDVIVPNTLKTVQFEAERGIAPWLDLNKKSLTITIERLPNAEELPLEFDTQKIVQYYSR